jgi:UDP-N-acetyl-D-galactosamine dehydrogenase
MGATFKENVSDIRNSKVADVVRELKDFGVNVEVIDPHASSDELVHEYGFGLVEGVTGKYDAAILAVNHKDYMSIEEDYFLEILHPAGIVADIKGVLRGRFQKIKYWSL